MPEPMDKPQFDALMARHGHVPCVQASLKTIASPAWTGTRKTHGPVFSNEMYDAGTGKFALWLPGTTAKPPSSGPASVNANDTTRSPFRISPSR